MLSEEGRGEGRTALVLPASHPATHPTTITVINLLNARKQGIGGAVHQLGSNPTCQSQKIMCSPANSSDLKLIAGCVVVEVAER